MAATIDAKDLSDLISRIYDAALAPNAFESALAAAVNMFGGCAGAIQRYDVPNRAAAFVATTGLPDHYRTKYLDQIARSNPLAPAYLFFEECEPITQPMVMADAEFQRTEFYRDWVAPQGLSCNLTTVLERSAAAFHMLSILAKPPRLQFEADDLALMRLIAPHFRKAIKIAGLLSEARARVDTLAELLDKLAFGAVAVERDGRIIYANAAAEQELERRTAIMESARMLRAVNAKADLSLREEIARCAGAGSACDIALPRDGESGLVAHVLPLQRRDLGLGPRAEAVVFFKVPEARVELPARALAERYALTEAEVRVLLEVAKGRSPAAIAERQGVAVSTVRTHLHRLFRKTGAQNQAELARLVAELITPLSAN
jgi:DNA-binding CsgD family transcriptional regulator